MGSGLKMQAPEPIHGFLTFRIARAHFALNAEAVSILKPWGVSLSEWRMLSVIASGACMTVRDCIRETRLAPAVVSRAVASLERRELIHSGRSASDRRILSVGLTEAGGRLHDRILPLMQQRQQRLLNALLPEERETFLGVLDRIEGMVGSGGSGE